MGKIYIIEEKKMFVLTSHFKQVINKTFSFQVFLLGSQQKMTLSTIQDINGFLISDLIFAKDNGRGKDKALLLSDLLSALFFVDK